MRVLHILSERGYSGGEEQLTYVLKHLKEAGHQSAMFLQPGAAYEATADELGIAAHHVTMRNGVDLFAARRLRMVFGRVPCDLIHLADSRAHKLAGLATFGRRPPAMVATRRMDYPIRSGWGMRRLYGRVVAGVVAISEAVRQEVLKIGVDPARVHLIHDGVEPERFEGLDARREQAREALGLPADAEVIVQAASLRPRKGQSHLIRAFASLQSSHPDAQLILAGDGSDREALRQLVEELGVQGRVHLPGQVEIQDCLALADVACVPSLKEGLSVFSLEAQSAGRPVVASRVGGLSESVADEETGLLVPPGDEGALASALARLLDDRDLRERLGAAGRARVKAQFTARQMAERTVELYEQLAAEGTPIKPRYG